VILDTTTEFSWHRLEDQYCGFLLIDCLRRDVKTIELGHQERRARTWSRLDLGDQIVVVGILLLVDVKQAWRGFRRAIPTPARHIDAFEVGVVVARKTVSACTNEAPWPVSRGKGWDVVVAARQSAKTTSAARLLIFP
jgi:hypothetical protein